MSSVRFLWPLVLAASLTACSGNLGGGQSTLPGAPQGTTANSVQQMTPPTPTASPVSASNVATFGDNAAPQALPAVMGWSGTIAFPPTSPASPSPNPKSAPAAGAAPAPGAVSIGITAAVVEPSDAPHFNPHSGGKHADAAARKGLFYVSLLATADVALSQYPKIALDVPRDIAAKYRDYTFGLALYDPQTKDKAYRLDIALRDLASPVPVSPPPSPTPTASPSAGPGGLPNGSMTPPPVGSGLDTGGGLPPEHVAFLGTAASLTLKANIPVIFALYVLPPQPSPAPSAAASSRASANPAATPSAAASALPPAPAASAP